MDTEVTVAVGVTVVLDARKEEVTRGGIFIAAADIVSPVVVTVVVAGVVGAVVVVSPRPGLFHGAPVSIRIRLAGGEVRLLLLLPAALVRFFSRFRVRIFVRWYTW